MNDLKTWLDARGISSEDAAKLFGVEPQTVRNWRSSGVPERRRLHVEAVMAAYGKSAEKGPRLLAELVIRPSLPQLQAWHNAAQSQGKDLEAWTIDGLDELASEWLNGLKIVASEVETKIPPTIEETLIAFPEIPLLHAAAGCPIVADSETYAPIRAYGPGRFACKLHGDSMAPRYPDGSVVILRERESLKRPLLKQGEIYLFVIEGERTLKIYGSRKATKAEIEAGIHYPSSQDGSPKTRILRSINPEFPEIVLKADGDCDWLGWLDERDN